MMKATTTRQRAAVETGVAGAAAVAGTVEFADVVVAIGTVKENAKVQKR